ncbi:hypothetical protein ACFWSF_08425 [Streptomyces sp. NPDC058611]|uniref:hypothetical protein n=1 Tax=unclassified Streptomyces TaxID=2593676 RepID=UPI003659D28B
MDLPLTGNTVFLRAPDSPGLIGAVTGALAGVPVTALQLAHASPPGNEVLLALSVGRPIVQETLDDAASRIDATRGWPLEQTA